jgi:hypothetical protein
MLSLAISVYLPLSLADSSENFWGQHPSLSRPELFDGGKINWENVSRSWQLASTNAVQDCKAYAGGKSLQMNINIDLRSQIRACELRGGHICGCVHERLPVERVEGCIIWTLKRFASTIFSRLLSDRIGL